MAMVQAVVQEGWREMLARLFARDPGNHVPFSQYASFKIGEGGFVDVPPRTPITPDPTFRDLQSEGAPLASGGTCEFTAGSATVTGLGTNFLADLVAGEWIKPGHQAGPVANSAGINEKDVWGQISSVDNGAQVTLTALYAGPTHLFAEARPCHKAAEPFFTFRKAFTNADVLFSSAVPAIVEVTAIVLAGEANADQLGNPPELFEMGIFSQDGVMVVYETFPAETKTGLITLTHIIELLY